ncbi:hypothetical protein [Psychromarinibacter halotolerans]|uniref:Uncharacterized protein n=1 Tax=Psychromarinibacter halotolerans TaxID=1775175 RepID=A0ABV7GRM3_9RHOB|nr:hypothetical protein [Psychromarinibacter halotolerans]MDF0595346.1 hypothetical protein [Psychromarinibacter halotolerans]
MFQSVPCRETVSLLWSLVFGAGDACVSLSMWSVLGALIPFGVAVFALQWVVKRLLFGRPFAPRGREVAPPLRAGQRRAAHLREGD